MRTPFSGLLGTLRRHIVLSAALFAFAALFTACYKAPVTGRSQLILIPQSEEIQLGLTAFQQLIKKEKISSNPAYNHAVGDVVGRIAKISDRPNFDWEYKVIEDDDQINAFALPGGKIGVYTGILPIAKNEAGLATVIGHEVAHATARHGGERITAGILAQLGAVGLNVALRNNDPAIIAIANSAYGMGVAVGAILPFSRTQEAEADRIGLVYMSKAGYNPKEAIYFWDRMNEATRDKQSPPEFLSTHPNYKTRRANLEKWQPEAMAYYNAAQKAPNPLIVEAREGGGKGSAPLAHNSH